MLFTETVFAPFLILTLLTLALVRRSANGQLWVLLCASYTFYGWWDVRFLALIVFSSVLDHVIGWEIYRTSNPRRRRVLVCVSLIANLGLLFAFKYSGFFLDSLRVSLAGIGFDSSAIPHLDILLPVGISFYTFQSLSYTLDVYRGQLEPTRSLLRFLVFVSAFPQLVAGPIVRAREMLPQLQGAFFARSDSAGLFYVFYGLAKKLYLADPLGAWVVDPLFRNPVRYGLDDALLGICAYSFQIFLDFSAYSDIAIGLGLLIGLRLPVNFRQPFAARSPADFWRRWHITLSSWFRDYLYIPLGGNRVPQHRLAANLMIVMLVAGLWHGAAWTFVVWGGLHGAALVVHRAWVRRAGASDTLPSPLWHDAACVLGTFVFVSLAFAIFRSPGVGGAMVVFSRLFASPTTLLFSSGAVATLIAAIAVHAFAEPRIERMSAAFGRWHWAGQGLAVYLGLAILLLSRREDVADRLFIYFQF